MKLNEQLVLELEMQLIDAIKSSDIGFLSDVLHDDLLFVAPNGTVITKEADLASHRAGNMIVDQLNPSFEEVRIDIDTAVVVVVYETKGTMLGSPIEGRFRYIRVWKQCSDGIKIIAGSCMMLP